MNIAEEIKARIGNDVEVEKMTVTKNNGVVLNGYCIRKKDSSVAPNIYYDESMTDEEIIDHVVSTYKDNANLHPDNLNDPIQDAFGSAESIYANVFPALINRCKNVDLLNDVIHRPFLDMEIIYKVRIFINGTYGIGSVTIKNEHAKHFNLDLDTLHENALRNMSSESEVTGMFDTLKKLGSIPDFVPAPDEEQMYIATNSNRINGASVIMLDDVMQELHSKLKSNEIIILPSSIHEVISLSADSADLDNDNLKAMVNEVNTTSVSNKEVLSDSIYIHNINGEWRVA